MEFLSSPLEHLTDRYDVVVVGSGYGGSIAASRLARAGKTVCLLERGRERISGEYPDTASEAAQATQFDTGSGLKGSEDALFRFSLHDDISVLTGNGLGGTSQINANVSLPPEPRVFEDPRWPESIRHDPDGLLSTSMERAREMLRPVTYPEDWPALAKLEALEEVAETMGEPFKRIPINVTFSDGPNHVGVEQAACTLCGDCVSGCNYSAKNTLIMNYLPDAKKHGAEIYCNVEARHVEKESDGTWTVHFRPTGLGREKFEAPDLFVRADIVVLAAGALGSTEVLLRSRENGLTTSDRVGESFTGNGDVLGLSYNGDREIHGVGHGSADPADHPPVGPCITGAIDVREQPRLEEGLIIEEGVIPGAISGLLPELLAISDATVGQDTDDGIADFAVEIGREAESLVRGPRHGAVDHTQTFLIMTHDDAGGTMDLDRDRLTISWPGVGEQSSILRANETLYEASAALGGTYIHNPSWSKLTGRDLVTVHPLGGCAMADDATTGVVDSRGRVFSGQKGVDVHDGLYVADGAILPCSVGVNPLLTISALAERICSLLALDRGWDIDYTLDSTPIETGSSTKPGFRFTETMRGSFSTSVVDDLAQIAAEKGTELESVIESIEDNGDPFEFTLTIASSDVEAMLDDPAHRAQTFGTVSAPSVHEEPLTFSDGTFELFSRDEDHPDIRRMVYRGLLTSEDGDRYDFEGLKIIRDDPGLDTWADTTTLYVSVCRSDGELVGRGVLRIAVSDLIRQLQTIKVPGADSSLERLRWKTRFGRLFAGEVVETYGLNRSERP